MFKVMIRSVSISNGSLQKCNQRKTSSAETRAKADMHIFWTFVRDHLSYELKDRIDGLFRGTANICFCVVAANWWSNPSEVFYGVSNQGAAPGTRLIAMGII
jgi:hypothetical protein